MPSSTLHPQPPAGRPATGLTPNELAKLLRVSPDRIRGWIKAGEMPALNVASARCRRPKYVVLPHHLQQFEHSRQAAVPKPALRRKKKATGVVDFYPD
jgi:excisionase family DNA binding protein